MLSRFINAFSYQEQRSQTRSIWQKMHIDIPLLFALILLISYGIAILYSASSQSLTTLAHQGTHIAFAAILMLLVAQIPPHTYERWSPILYIIGVTLLLGVILMGHINKGAQRWLNLGVINFQPSELMKLAVPMCLCYYFSKRPLPPSLKHTIACLAITGIPALLVAKQPDLGTSILIMGAGLSVLFIAGLPWRFLGLGSLLTVIALPMLWFFMHDYQRNRVLTFLKPERDPLGAGYHIIQSKIAIGSGGIVGKGFLNGTQSHLHFLPEHATDFIFAVCGEEFGLIGCVILFLFYILIILRGFYIAIHAQDTFSRLLAGSLTLLFFISFFINLGMVSGILPVVGVPLPLISYGGTSMVTLMVSFGMLMSIQTHRKLLSC
ncbi:MAG: rod shape-determining protein RodA [Gammaproteobacteria bacterium]